MPPPSTVQQAEVSPLKSIETCPDAREEGFDFSAEPKFFGPFTIFHKGQSAQYIVREALEAGHVAYKDETSKSMKVSGSSIDNMTASLEGGSKADTILIQKCLFKVIAITSGDQVTVREDPVTLGFVMDLPRRITGRLYQKIRQISGMDEEQETVEFLTKRIESDRKKIARLEKDGVPGKDEPSSTTNTS